MKFRAGDLKDYIMDECSFEEKGLEFVETDGWSSEGKYEYIEYIFKHNGKFYSVSDSRSGSYYSDYWYKSEDWKDEDMIECPEVKKKEKITYEWIVVK